MRTIRATTLLGVASVAVLVGMLAGGGAARACPVCTVTWTGAKDTAWTNTKTWSPAVVPGPSDYVCLPAAGASPAIGAADPVVSVAGVSLSGATLSVNGSLTLTDNT